MDAFCWVMSELTLGGLTEKQSRFVACYVMGSGNAKAAAKEAGYESAHQEGWRLLQLPHIRAAICVARDRIIRTDLAQLGLATMRELMEDKETPAHVRLQAARWSLEAAGHAAAKSLGLPAADKPLAEMSVDELKAFVEHGKTALDSLKSASAPIIEVGK